MHCFRFAYFQYPVSTTDGPSAGDSPLRPPYKPAGDSVKLLAATEEARGGAAQERAVTALQVNESGSWVTSLRGSARHCATHFSAYLYKYTYVCRKGYIV